MYPILMSMDHVIPLTELSCMIEHQLFDHVDNSYGQSHIILICNTPLWPDVLVYAYTNMKSLGFKIKKKYFAQDKNNPLFDTVV